MTSLLRCYSYNLETVGLFLVWVVCWCSWPKHIISHRSTNTSTFGVRYTCTGNWIWWSESANFQLQHLITISELLCAGCSARNYKTIFLSYGQHYRYLLVSLFCRRSVLTSGFSWQKAIPVMIKFYFQNVYFVIQYLISSLKSLKMNWQRLRYYDKLITLLRVCMYMRALVRLLMWEYVCIYAIVSARLNDKTSTTLM